MINHYLRSFCGWLYTNPQFLVDIHTGWVSLALFFFPSQPGSLEMFGTGSENSDFALLRRSPELNHLYLVGGWASPLKHMSSSVGMIIYIWILLFPTHQINIGQFSMASSWRLPEKQKLGMSEATWGPQSWSFFTISALFIQWEILWFPAVKFSLRPTHWPITLSWYHLPISSYHPPSYHHRLTIIVNRYGSISSYNITIIQPIYHNGLHIYL